MANLDVVARLQLRAEQFSSETGARFAEMKQRAASAAQDVRTSFTSSFAEVQKLAQQSLTMPRTTTGSLDLSGEIASLNLAAQAAENKALAMRELSIAQTAAAASGKVDVEAMRLEADASAVGALAHERDAAAIRDRIGALELVQKELNKTASITRVSAAANDEAASHTGRASNASMELMHAVRASADAYAAGIPLSQIFAMESGRVSQAASMAGGSLGVVGKFMGTYGIALTAVGAIAGPFIAKMMDTNSALEDQKSDLEKATSAADAYGNAQSLLGKVLDLTTGKLKTQNLALIEQVRLTAESNLLSAQADKKKALADIAQIVPETYGASSVAFAGPSGQRGDSDAAVRAQLAQIQRNDTTTAPLRGLLTQIMDGTAGNVTQIRQKVDALEKAGQLIGKSDQEIIALKERIYKLPTAAAEEDAAQLTLKALDGKGVDPKLKPYERPKTDRSAKPRDRSNESAAAAEEIARINAEWVDQPKLIEKAQLETQKLENLIAKLTRDKPPGFEKLIADARVAERSIQDGMDRPFQEFMRHQRESLAVQQLSLQGRDAEAAAMADALQLQEKQGPLDAAHLAQLLKIEQQHERIAEALEDQRRIVSIYTGGVDNLHRSFDSFLASLSTNPGGAVTGLLSGWAGGLKKLKDDLLSNTLFGSMDRDVEKYVRQMTGRRTPAEILEDQASAAGTALKTSVGDAGSALDDFVRAVRGATGGLTGGVAANDNGKPDPQLLAYLARGNGVTDADAVTVNGGTPDVVVNGTRPSPNLFSGAVGIMVDDLTKGLHNLGITVPDVIVKGLKQHLPDAIQGMQFGQLGGGIFSAITGGKNNQLASGVGGILGEAAGKSLTKPITDIFGKTLGGIAGPLGGIVGGVLGNLVGGLFTSVKWANSTVGMNGYGSAVASGTANGNGSSALAAARGEASSVAAGINQLAQQLGATITNLPAMTLGTWNGNYRVADLATTQGLNANNFQMGVNLHDFGGDQQAAIEYAVRYSISHAVITGISQASKNIIANGSNDLQSAVSKALMIESVPKDLKAMLDPVGAAVDALNLKWQQTVNALKEGGATADQMTQAQELYNLQLQQTKASTDAADKTLQDFLTSLKVGSSSPYSLRDQEGTAKANLQPFLDQINAGQVIDQAKYQTAAQSYLDVERQLYGSTQQYFDAMDAVQAATNKAISTIDNATPVKASVDSPFIQATATNTANANDLLAQMSDQLSGLSAQLASLGISAANDFIGTDRLFSKTG